MILTIQQYIEALENSAGRFRTLRKVWPVANGQDGPVFSVPGHGLVDFEVVADGRPMTLRCPLRSGAEAEVRLRTLAGKDRGLASEFFDEWEPRGKEIVLYDGNGNPVETDVLSRFSRQGTSPGEFLQAAADSRDTKLIMTALGSLARLAEWARDHGREVAVRRLSVCGDGSVHTTGFSAKGELGDAALAFFFTAAMPGLFAEVGLPLLTRAAVARPVAIRLCSEAALLGFPEPGQILAGDVAGPALRLADCPPEKAAELGRQLAETVASSRPESIPVEQSADYAWAEDESDGIRCVRDTGGWRYVGRDDVPVIDRVWAYAAPFREGRAEVGGEEGMGLIDKQGRHILEPVYEEVAWDEYWGLVAVMAEGRWSLLDREGKPLTESCYDWLGECSEGLILAQKDGKCGFLDTEGREAIPFVYDDATSFSEGCALVSVGGGNFYIDNTGKELETHVM